MQSGILKYVVAAAAVWACVTAVNAETIPVANGSFEFPVIDPNENPYYAIPVVPYWIELDTDTDPLYGGRNTGIFLNTPPDSPAGDHIVNAHGRQLAFLFSQTGNALLQDLQATYQAGRNYRLTVDVCPSLRLPPATDPNNVLLLEFYYRLDDEPVTLQTASVPSTALQDNFLKPFSVSLPAVLPDDPWAGKPIGIALRAQGSPSGYWDLDNVRLEDFPRLPDLTGNGRVNLEDVSVLAAEWQACQASADLTGDECVDIEDLLILTEYWLDVL